MLAEKHNVKMAEQTRRDGQMGGESASRGTGQAFEARLNQTNDLTNLSMSPSTPFLFLVTQY